MLKIKICGITNLEDAELAVRYGATALGFNFYRPSPRYIEPVDAALIVARLPANVEKIAVFVNEDIETMNKASQIAGTSTIQLHGDETDRTVRLVTERTGQDVIKAFRVHHGFRPADVRSTGAKTVLLDTYSAGSYGGTGESFSWDLAKAACCEFPRIYLAGGLGIDNIEAAIAEVRPFGVDSCSALESKPGKKDPVKLVAFLKLALAAAARNENEL